jgi:hypothetical protein
MRARGNPLGMREGDALWHQFAQDQREVRDDDHHGGHADVMGVMRRNATMLGEILLQALAKRRLAEGAEQNRDDRDPDLHRRQEARRVALQFERGFGAGVARGSERLQPCRPRRH